MTTNPYSQPNASKFRDRSEATAVIGTGGRSCAMKLQKSIFINKLALSKRDQMQLVHSIKYNVDHQSVGSNSKPSNQNSFKITNG